jgi:ABC-type uncharacterized transport system substrate-binding protein
MRRREFIKVLSSTVMARPLATRAQQVATPPVIGFLYPGTPAKGEQFAAGLRKGLGEAGYTDGHNVTIVVGWGENNSDRLKEVVADFVRRNVAIIVAGGLSVASVKAATTTIPIVFAIGFDPVQAGYVASLNRPGGNITGVSTMNIDLVAKWVDLLHQLLPNASRFATLVDTANPGAQAMSNEAKAAAAAAGLEMQVLPVSEIRDIENVFVELAQTRADALLVMPDALFLDNREQVAALALGNRIPTIYAIRDLPEAGGLMSYGSDFVDTYRLAGIIASKILQGEKPGDLPIERASKFEFVINLKTAKALGLTFPPNLLALADQVIE